MAASRRRVVSLQKVKDARAVAAHETSKYTAEKAAPLILDIFDRMTRSAERPQREARAQLERLNRKRI